MSNYAPGTELMGSAPWNQPTPMMECDRCEHWQPCPCGCGWGVCDVDDEFCEPDCAEECAGFRG